MIGGWAVGDGQDFFELAVTALADTIADKGPDGDSASVDLRLAIQEAAVSLKGRIDVPDSELDTVIESALSRRSAASHFEVTRRKIARWFEVALDEFDQVPLNRLVPDILFRHVYYENLLAGWFQDWGYQVRVGEELEGLEGTDFIPDVYAELGTLHGHYSVAVTLFCSNPPNTWRVLGMLENLEAFTKRALEFGERDIYFMVTPFKFLEQASNHIRLQAKEEPYFVVCVEGNELEDLEREIDPLERHHRLQALVESAAHMQSDELF
jgi:hypothetical protein